MELVGSELKLGNGQVLEQEMALEVGLPILRIEQKSVDESEQDLRTGSVEDMAKRHSGKMWDAP